MKLLATLLALASANAFALTVNCPNHAKIVVGPKTAAITYAARMEFTDNKDIANFLSKSELETAYQARKWGANIAIPNSLLNGSAKTAVVIFYLPEDAPEAEYCTRE